MPKLSKDNATDAVVFIGERDPYVKEAIRSAMHNMGVRTIRAQSSMSQLKEQLQAAYPDFLYVSDDFDAGATDLVKGIRDGGAAKNPYMLITILMSSREPDDLSRAVNCSADDVIVKPVSVNTVIDRFEKVVFQRQPFIATTDYTGPERRRSAGSRPSRIKQVEVLNTLRRKADGEHITSETIDRSVAETQQALAEARMDSHGLRLSYVCQQIMNAYDEGNITEAVEENIGVLVTVLEEAGATAGMIGDAQMAKLTQSLAEKVEGVKERYEDPTEEDLQLIKKLTVAFMSALGSQKDGQQNGSTEAKSE